MSTITVELTEPQLRALISAATLAATSCEQDGPASIGWTDGAYRAVTNAERVLRIVAERHRTHL